MAAHLESLASHYDQMATALRESEAGEEFSDEDIHGVCDFLLYTKFSYLISPHQDMNRDTNELPLIMAELEEAADIIESYQ